MKTNVGVFFGASSVEHEVAVISAVQAMNSMDREKYDITPIYITKEGEMFTGDVLFDIESYRDIESMLKECKQVTVCSNKGKFTLVWLKGGLFKKHLCEIDIAFPIVHGTNCEDGSIVGMFELLGVPYVSCDVLSAAVGMDKAVFKDILNANGIPTLPCVSFRAKSWVAQRDEIIAKIEANSDYPVIVKPANLGSSVGIKKADSKDKLIESVEYAMNFATKILVEPAITSLRELNCSVLGDADECETSVIEEPVMTDEILSYDNKYKGGGKSKGMSSLQRKVPADITPDEQSRVEQYAKETFVALGCCGVSRIDFLLDTSNGNIYVNEINTIPGSLSFYLWEPKGVPYKELLDRMIELGFKRARTKANLTFTYETNILSSGNAFGAKGCKK